MKTQRVVLLMLLLFVVETTIVPWLIPDAWYGRVAPHFVFVFALFAGLYTGRHEALLLGFSFGILQDIVFYGHMLGVHALSMGVIAYVTGLLLEKRRSPMIAALAVIGLASLAYDSAVYGIYRAFRVTVQPYDVIFIHSIAPSLFLQLGFALAVYVPARRLFEGAAKKQAEEEE